MTQNPRTYIIAEAGVNHNGNIDMAVGLIRAAAKIGADAIKFQTFQLDKIIHPNATQTEYQKKNSRQEKQSELLTNLQLSRKQFEYLKKVSDQHHIQFLSTPFDTESLDFLIQMDLPFIKIASGDITYGSLLLKAAQSGRKVLLSTGMANLEEVQEALWVLAYGYAKPQSTPTSFDEVAKFSQSIDCQKILQDKVTLFQCTSEYPAPLDEINLNVIDMFRVNFGLSLGYSDHSLGDLVPCLAVAKGVAFVEKHITLDNNLEGPDHKASLNVDQFKKMIDKIRLTEKILGQSVKVATTSETKNKPLVRRGIYASESLVKGHELQEGDLVCLRPINSTSPMKIWNILGKKTSQTFEKWDPISD